MLIALISALIWIAIAALLVVLVLWILRSVANIAVPDRVEKIIWVVFALVALLVIARAVLGLGSLPAVA